MIQLIIVFFLEITIFTSFILLIKFIIYQFKIRNKIFIWIFFLFLLPIIFIFIEDQTRVSPFKLINKKLDNFQGFLYELNRFQDNTPLELIKFMKKYPNKIIQTDFIIGYTTPYITINNKSNLNHAKIIRLSYSNNTKNCLSKSSFSKYFLSYKNRYHFNYSDFNETDNGQCLTLKQISFNEVNRYQYKPPVINNATNQIKSIFPPFLHRNTTILSAVAPSMREEYAIENKESNRNNYMVYSVTSLYFGSIQNIFSTVFIPSDTQLLEHFLNEVKP